jgi:tetratricopeptide (TPR) repeat protein
MAAHERREYPLAFAEYQAAVQVDPTFFEAQHNLAIIALNLGNLPVALTASENALALRPDSSSARWNYAIALQRGKYAADAAEELEKYVTVEKSNARASLMLAGLYALDLGEPDSARPHYERVLAIDPQHPQADSIRQWLATHPKR